MAFQLLGTTARVLPFALGAALFAASCSSSSEDGDGGGGDLVAPSVVQNLTVDPDGNTVSIEIAGATGTVSTASVEASDGQMAVSVVRTGSTVAVEFDSRVTPEHRVRVLGVDGVSPAWRDVTTSDGRQVQIAVLSATQDTSDALLGGDEIEASFYGGPRVVASQVEDLDSWTVTVGGLNLDLTGSTVAFDPSTQLATLTLGPLASLHAQFSVSVDAESVAAVAVNPAVLAATATGDSVPPALEGGSPVVQNVDPLAAGDEFGRTIDIKFGEPISPLFGAQPSNFSVVDHPAAVGMTSVTRVSLDPLDPTLVRVLFSRPVVPGLDQIAIDGVVDAHGNPFPAQSVAVENLSPTANSYASVDFITREGLNNDSVVAVLAQAIDPDTADLDARWSLAIDSVLVDLSAQEISYDLTAKTLTIDLDFDVINGTTADLASVGATDIDGEDFTLSANQVTAAGDAGAPQLSEVIQNRIVDSDGTTVDVLFSEALDVTTATDTANYSFSPALTVNGAVLVDGSTVRLELASVAIPGDVSLTVGAAVADPAGNALGAPAGPAPLASTDVQAPAPSVAAARAIEGLDNDVVTVLFTDTMIQSEVEMIGSWSIESPVGSPIDLSSAIVSYDPSIGTAEVTLAGPNGAALFGGDDFEVSLMSMRDLGGNAIDVAAIGGPIIAENTRPLLEAVFAVSGGLGDQIIMRFSEPMRNLEDLFVDGSNPAGVRYVQIDSVTSAETLPVSALSLDGGLGVLLTYPAPIDVAGTLSIVGLTDLAGNLLFPIFNVDIAPENLAAPALSSTPALTANAGVENDTLSIQFSSPMSTWKLLDPAQYTLEETVSGNVIDLSSAKMEFDGNDTVTFELSSLGLPEFSAALSYDVTLNVDGVDPLRTSQGVPISAPETAASVGVVGDVTDGPVAAMSQALIDPAGGNALIVIFSETVDMSAALDPAGYELNGSLALTLEEYSPRAVRATFTVAPMLGDTLEILAANAVDSAGNEAPGLMSLAVTGDLVEPAIASVAVSVEEGLGGDVIAVTFSEEMDGALAGNRQNYTVTVGGEEVRVGAAVYSSNDFTVSLIPDDLPEGATVNVEVSGVSDLVGNLPVANLTDSGVATGDDVVPFIASSAVNLGRSDAGLVVDVLFSEPVVGGFATRDFRWTGTGATTVLEAEAIAVDHVRLTLSAALAPNGTLTLQSGLSDHAGNVAGTLVTDPTE